MANSLKRGWTPQEHLAHVGHIKQTDALTHLLVLFDDPRVRHRKLPATEVDQAPTGGLMVLKKWCAFEAHAVIPPGAKKSPQRPISHLFKKGTDNSVRME